MTYRPATPSELRRIGTPHRIVGSKWYRSGNVPCVYPSNKRRDWRSTIKSARDAFDRQHAVEAIALKGDGQHLRKLLEDLSGRESADELKIALVEARYQDWLHQQKGTDMTTKAKPTQKTTKTATAKSKRTEAPPSPSPEGVAFVERIVAAQSTPVTNGADEIARAAPRAPAIDQVVWDAKPEKAAAMRAPKTTMPPPAKPTRAQRHNARQNKVWDRAIAARKSVEAAGAPTNGAVKFAEAFSRTFAQLLGPHGYKQIDAPKPELVVFSKDGTLVEITNPSQPGGSKSAPFTVKRDDGAVVMGMGRDALATELGVPRLARG